MTAPPTHDEPATRFGRYARVIMSQTDGPAWQQAWRDFVADYTAEIEAVARAMRADPDETVGNALVHLWQIMPGLKWDEERSFTPLLRRIVRNVIYDRVRRQCRENRDTNRTGGTSAQQALANHPAAPRPSTTGQTAVDPAAYGSLLTRLIQYAETDLEDELRFNLAHAPRLEAIEAALDALEEPSRVVIYEYFVHGVQAPAARVAEATGRELPAVQMQLSRFRSRLRRELAARLPNG